MFKVILKGISIIIVVTLVVGSYISWCAYGLYQSVHGEVK